MIMLIIHPMKAIAAKVKLSPRFAGVNAYIKTKNLPGRLALVALFTVSLLLNPPLFKRLTYVTNICEG